METGKVVEIIGAVIDVQFPRESIPNIYDALIIDEGNLTLEVQQQIGDGIVRTIAMGTTDGLKRGLNVTNTGAPINVPVGEEILPGDEKFKPDTVQKIIDEINSKYG